MLSQCRAHLANCHPLGQKIWTMTDLEWHHHLFLLKKNPKTVNQVIYLVLANCLNIDTAFLVVIGEDVIGRTICVIDDIVVVEEDEEETTNPCLDSETILGVAMIGRDTLNNTTVVINVTKVKTTVTVQDTHLTTVEVLAVNHLMSVVDEVIVVVVHMIMVIGDVVHTIVVIVEEEAAEVVVGVK